MGIKDVVLPQFSAPTVLLPIFLKIGKIHSGTSEIRCGIYGREYDEESERTLLRWGTRPDVIDRFSPHKAIRMRRKERGTPETLWNLFKKICETPISQEVFTRFFTEITTPIFIWPLFCDIAGNSFYISTPRDWEFTPLKSVNNFVGKMPFTILAQEINQTKYQWKIRWSVENRNSKPYIWCGMLNVPLVPIPTFLAPWLDKSAKHLPSVVSPHEKQKIEEALGKQFPVFYQVFDQTIKPIVDVRKGKYKF